MTTLAPPAIIPKPAQVVRDDSPRPAPPSIPTERRALPDEKPAPPPIVRAAPHARCAQATPYKFDVHQYYAMAEAGILHPDDRVELIDGEIIVMSGIGPEHMATVDSSTEFWVIAVSGRAIVRIQGSIRLDERNEPQPDVALLKRRADFYRSRTAGPDDVLLLIEVSDTTLRRDREVKLELYARFGVPETWIANIRARTIEAYTDPVDGEYATRRTFHHGQTVSPAAFPDIALPVSDVIGGLPDAEG